jgi:hypothetical protein
MSTIFLRIAVFISLFLLASDVGAREPTAAWSANVRLQASEIGRNLVRGSSHDEFRDYLQGIRAENPDGDVVRLLRIVFQGSLEEAIEEKKYFATKAKMYDEMGKALSEYLDGLVKEHEEWLARNREADEGHFGACNTIDATAHLDRSAARVEAQIARLPSAERASRDVQQLVDSLRRDRAVIALARQEFTMAEVGVVLPLEESRPGIIGEVHVLESGSGQLSLDPATDRPGHDYKSFDLVEGRPELCRDACAKDPACKAYTYVKPGIQGDTAHCWLKNAASAPVQAPCCASGARTGGR